MKQTFKQFKECNPGGYVRIAAEDIPGFAKRGSSLYGNCDNMIVASYLHKPMEGIYTVYLKEGN